MDFDFQAFYRGDCFDAYKFLGAHTYFGGTVFRVYAPAARSISVIGEFNDWTETPMQRMYDGQFWECSIRGADSGHMYKYRVYKNDGSYVDHTDPYAFMSEVRPGTASVICDLEYEFTDEKWLKERNDRKKEPLSIYEVHLGSWMRKKKWEAGEDPKDGFLTYEETAKKLVPYIKEHGFNAVEIMPLAEYPADESWGYQGTGFYSATSRYGSPLGLKKLIDECHAAGISVIHDVVTVHFAVNDYALSNFDGTSLYEYPHPAVGVSEWGSVNFIHSRGDVRSFLQSSCRFWLEEYHFDGLRFDAVSNLLYWQGNYGRGENRDAIAFLSRMNKGLKKIDRSIMLIAEDSTMYRGTTVPADRGGLGFDYKWDLGWMHDTLDFLSADPYFRKGQYGKILTSMSYFGEARYILPLSHDEVVHGKGTITGKLFGTFTQKLAQARELYLYMMTHPGKKLNFMGNELAQANEWDEKVGPSWENLDHEIYREFLDYFTALNKFYAEHPALWKKDYDPDGFAWAESCDDDQQIYAYRRFGGREKLYVIFNFSGAEQVYHLNDTDTGRLKLLFASEKDADWNDGKYEIRLPAFCGLCFEEK